MPPTLWHPSGDDSTELRRIAESPVCSTLFDLYQLGYDPVDKGTAAFRRQALCEVHRLRDDHPDGSITAAELKERSLLQLEVQRRMKRGQMGKF